MSRATCGMGRCLHCKGPYVRTRWWSKYCSPYCKKMQWHINKRRGK